jgi:Uma2 family endonuclease
MGLPQPVKRYTPEEYYALEREAEYKSEYYQGEIFAMAGSTSRHSLITINIGGELRVRLKGKPCTPYDSNQRLRIKATGLRTYPDVSVYCGNIEYDAADLQVDTAINPTVVFEVLSKSTESFDRGAKAKAYRQIDSLRAHVLVSQEEPHVEVYERQSTGDWLLHEVSGLAASIRIPGIEIELPLAEIYDRVQFGPENSEAA